MMDPIKSNLEPIEENDLDMEGKIKRGFTGVENKETVPFSGIEKEAPNEVIASEKDDAYNKILAKVQSPASDETTPADVANDAQTVSQQTNAETQIQQLADVAQQKGVIHAVKVARHMEDNYVLDVFHDRLLADELHDALVQKGMIKEI
jgi:hypothetical protein